MNADKAALQFVELSLPASMPKPTINVTVPAPLALRMPSSAHLLLHDERQTELAAHLLRQLNSLPPSRPC